MLRIMVLSITMLGLIGCAHHTALEPEAFGVRESIWRTLNSEQKSQVIEGYNQKLKRDSDRQEKSKS